MLQISKDMIFEKQRAFLSVTRHPLCPVLGASRSAFEGSGTISTLCNITRLDVCSANLRIGCLLRNVWFFV